MAEYIDRKALGIGKCNPDIFEDKGYANGWNSAIKIIEEAPAVDVEPVKCEKWEVVRTCNNFIKHMYKCPACEKNQFARSNYCPNCGAKMDGESND